MNPSENALSEQTIPQAVVHTVVIDAPRERVWEALTNIEHMRRWMAEPEIQMDIVTNWIVGDSIVIKGFHHEAFENRGTVLEFDPPNVLRYSQLSSVSRLANNPENHSIFEFRLTPVNGHTSLTLTLSGFPTESIFRHLDFYWRVTISILEQFVETSQ